LTSNRNANFPRNSAVHSPLLIAPNRSSASSRENFVPSWALAAISRKKNSPSYLVTSLELPAFTLQEQTPPTYSRLAWRFSSEKSQRLGELITANSLFSIAPSRHGDPRNSKFVLIRFPNHPVSKCSNHRGGATASSTAIAEWQRDRRGDDAVEFATSGTDHGDERARRHLISSFPGRKTDKRGNTRDKRPR